MINEPRPGNTLQFSVSSLRLIRSLESGLWTLVSSESNVYSSYGKLRFLEHFRSYRSKYSSFEIKSSHSAAVYKFLACLKEAIMRRNLTDASSACLTFAPKDGIPAPFPLAMFAEQK